MNSSVVIHQARLNQWAETIQAQKSSSLSVAEYREQYHLSRSQFYYWKRKLKDKFVEPQLPDIS